MAPHVRLERIATGMRQALAVTCPPLACVLLLSVLDVRIVNMLNQLIHVALVASRAPVPIANGHLVLEVRLIKSCIDRRAGDIP